MRAIRLNISERWGSGEPETCKDDDVDDVPDQHGQQEAVFGLCLLLDEEDESLGKSEDDEDQAVHGAECRYDFIDLSIDG